MYVTLRQGESVTLMRQNVGKFYNAKFPKAKVEAGGPVEIAKKVTYSNGRLVWKPDLRKIAADELLWTGSKNVKVSGNALVPAKAGEPGVAVFRVWCPWVLVESKVTLSSRKEAMKGTYEVSFDGGVAWSNLGEPGWRVRKTGIGVAEIDLSKFAAGRYEVLLRVTFDDGAVVPMEFNNLFQVATLSLPKLKVGANKVTVSRGPDEGVVQLIRSSGKPAKKRYIVESKGLASNQVAPAKRDGSLAYVVYRLTAPAPLTAVSVGAATTMDRGRRQRIEALYSTDGGKSWASAWKIVDNSNGQNSSFEMDKRVELKNPAGAKEVLVKFEMERRTKYFGVNSIRLYAFYRQPQPEGAKLAVELKWEEKAGGGWAAKTKSVLVDKFPHTVEVECAGESARFAGVTMKPAE